MVQKWVDQTYSEQQKLHNKPDPILDDLDDVPQHHFYFDIFVDGQWGWPFYGPALQVLQCTLPHPYTARGYVAAMAVMDVKSTEDYIKALRSFVEDVVAAIERWGLQASDCLRWHVDEEDALTGALEKLGGGFIVGCRFHKAQNVERQLKIAFPVRR